MVQIYLYCLTVLNLVSVVLMKIIIIIIIIIKIIEIVVIRCHILRLKFTKFDFGGSLQRSPRPLSWIEGVLLLREWTGGEERGVEGIGGEGWGGNRTPPQYWTGVDAPE